MADTEEMSPPGEPVASDEETVIGSTRDAEADVPQLSADDVHDADADVPQLVVEEVQDEPAPSEMGNGSVAGRYREIMQEQREDGSELSSLDAGSVDALPRRVGSPIDSIMSGPDDTPSIQVCREPHCPCWPNVEQGSFMSSPGSSVLPSGAARPGMSSPTPSFRPFDRRFQSRIGSSSIHSPRSASPGFLHSHSRNASLSSNFIPDQADTDTLAPPWEVVRWTRLKKLNGQAFTEAGRRNFGSPTCLAVSALIALGTSKGIILMFDYNQNLKMIIGPGTKGKEMART